MNVFKKCNPWILKQDAYFIRVNKSATKPNCQQNFFAELRKKAHISQYNVFAR